MADIQRTISPEVINVVVGAATFVASISAAIATFSWRARGMVAEFDAKLTYEVSQVREEMKLDRDELSHRNGEVMQAIRQKINDVEIWNRDNFVRRGDLTDATSALNKSIDVLRADVTSTMTRIESKIDKLGR